MGSGCCSTSFDLCACMVDLVFEADHDPTNNSLPIPGPYLPEMVSISAINHMISVPDKVNRNESELILDKDP